VLDPDPDDPPPPSSSELPFPGQVLEQVLAAPTVALAQDERGNRCLAGGFADAIRFDEQVLQSRGARDVFIARFAGDALLWSARFGDAEDQLATAVALGPDGSCVIAGMFRGQLELGEFRLQSPAVYPRQSVFVAQVSAAAGAGNAAESPELLATAVLATSAELAARSDLTQPRVTTANIMADSLTPGSSVGVSLDAEGKLLVALANPASLGLNAPIRIRVSDLPFSDSIPAGGCSGYSEFDLCHPVVGTSFVAPRPSCMLGRDPATRQALDVVCANHPECCADLTPTPRWNAACVQYLTSISSICECKSPAALLGVAPGQTPLPPQEPCCNSITEAVCAQSPRCCSVKWDHVCASCAAAPSLSCE
jgi:hypothetical protein